jgi:hypothetical protein
VFLPDSVGVIEKLVDLFLRERIGKRLLENIGFDLIQVKRIQCYRVIPGQKLSYFLAGCQFFPAGRQRVIRLIQFGITEQSLEPIEKHFHNL